MKELLILAIVVSLVLTGAYHAAVKSAADDFDLHQAEHRARKLDEAAYAAFSRAQDGIDERTAQSK